jgi:hypothetical protein
VCLPEAVTSTDSLYTQAPSLCTLTSVACLLWSSCTGASRPASRNSRVEDDDDAKDRVSTYTSSLLPILEPPLSRAETDSSGRDGPTTALPHARTSCGQNANSHGIHAAPTAALTATPEERVNHSRASVDSAVSDFNEDDDNFDTRSVSASGANTVDATVGTVQASTPASTMQHSGDAPARSRMFFSDFAPPGSTLAQDPVQLAATMSRFCSRAVDSQDSMNTSTSVTMPRMHSHCGGATSAFAASSLHSAASAPTMTTVMAMAMAGGGPGHASNSGSGPGGAVSHVGTPVNGGGMTVPRLPLMLLGNAIDQPMTPRDASSDKQVPFVPHCCHFTVISRLRLYSESFSLLLLSPLTHRVVDITDC